MKTFNLDKFANERSVIWKGKTYTIRGITLEDEINKNISERIMSAGDDTKSRLLALKDFVLCSTSFKEEDINKMNLETLFALFKIAQGIDPEEEDKEGNADKE